MNKYIINCFNAAIKEVEKEIEKHSEKCIISAEDVIDILKLLKDKILEGIN